jgi:tetratricopeptide (TPR) repeat protein
MPARLREGFGRFLRRRETVPLLVAAVTALVFWAAVRNGFIDVDDSEFLNHPFRGLGFSSIRGIFTSVYFSHYVPLTFLSLSVDFALWGMNPFGYHLTNLLLHAANAAVFYLLCLEFLSLGGATDDDRPAAAAAALFFSLHPLRVQSVAWVTERKDVLCGFFFLLTLLFWMRSFRRGRLQGARGRAAALGSFFLALLAKPAVVPLPLVLILLDVWPLRRLPASPRRWGAAPFLWKEKLPFLFLAAVFAAATAAAQSKGGSIVSVAHAVPLQRANQIGLNLVFYLGKLLWPANLSFYEWHWPPICSAVLIGTAATAALLGVAAWSRRLRAPLLCAFAYQSLMLAPILGFVTIGHELVADRYSYLSGLAWAVLFGAGLRTLARRHRAVSMIFACVLLTAFAAATRAQIAVWKDSVSLWKQAVRVDPASLAARPSLADALVANGRVGEAILNLEEHMLLNPQDDEIRRSLADLIAKTGTTERDHAGFHEQLGREFAAQGDFDKAAWHFERGLRYDPGSESLRAELAQARLRSKPR